MNQRNQLDRVVSNLRKALGDDDESFEGLGEAEQNGMTPGPTPEFYRREVRSQDARNKARYNGQPAPKNDGGRVKEWQACPRCGEDGDVGVSDYKDPDDSGTNRWECGSCGHTWNQRHSDVTNVRYLHNLETSNEASYPRSLGSQPSQERSRWRQDLGDIVMDREKNRRLGLDKAMRRLDTLLKDFGGPAASAMVGADVSTDTAGSRSPREPRRKGSRAMVAKAEDSTE